MEGNWRAKVYKKSQKMSEQQGKEWLEIRNRIIKRDKYTCQRCVKRFKSMRGLTAHHIQPREEGGTNDSENLITLCNKCHDEVELACYRSVDMIVGLPKPGKEKKKRDPHIAQMEKDNNYVRPEWHRWVYGGQRKLD